MIGDHPRIRGEHAVAIVKAAWEGGSSPHTRGAHPRRTASACRRRIIPAYAGSTRFRWCAIRPGRDHPRIRGEHIIGSIGMVIGWGSSPHTRGAHPKAERGLHRERIIPAYAGSTGGEGDGRYPRADHPRIRGEHSATTSSRSSASGSSPHTRGALHVSPFLSTGWRIIPAYAGSTVSLLVSHFRPSDHPRIRGEHIASVRHSSKVSGSSPHTRGARYRHRHGL